MQSFIDQTLQPLLPYLRIEQAVEVCINRFGEVWVETADKGFLPPIEAPELNQSYFEGLMSVLATCQGGWFRPDTPQVSAQLPQGHRFEGILCQSAVKSGIVASIRLKQTGRQFSFSDFKGNPSNQVPQLQDEERLTPELSLSDIQAIIEAKLQTKQAVLLISGCMGSGKTSLFDSLLRQLPEKTRLLSVEDTFELNFEHLPNCANLLIDRNDKSKHFDYNQALNSILRLRPDVICSGELSLENSQAILRLLNLGHGFMCTLHAQNAISAITQVFQQNIRLLGGQSDGVEKLLKSHVDAVIHLEKANHQKIISEVYFPKQDFLWKNQRPCEVNKVSSNPILSLVE